MSEKEITVKPEVAELAATIKKELKVDAKTGSVTISDGVYAAHLPEDNTEKSVKSLQNYNTRFVAAASLALGEVLIPVMKKTPTITESELTIPMVGKDKIVLGFDRSKMVGAGPGSTERIEKFGSSSAKLVTQADSSKGELSKVRTMLSEMAKEAFASK